MALGTTLASPVETLRVASPVVLTTDTALTYVNSELGSWLDLTTDKPDQATANLLDAIYTTIKATVTIGSTAELFMLQVYAGYSPTMMRRDLIVPSRVATVSGSPTWPQNQGPTFNGTTYVDTGCNVNSIVSSNAESMGVFVTNNVNANTEACGSSTTSIQPRRSTGDNVNARNQSATGTTGSAGTATTSVGMSSINRSTSGTIRFLRNGVFYEDLARTSTGIANDNIFVGGRNNGSGVLSGGGTHRVAAVWAGKNLSDAKHLAIYNALNTYLTAIGAV